MFEPLATTAAGARTPAQRVRAFARVENAACARRLVGMYDMLSAAYASLCREHHLAKTFWPGFSVDLHPDGTMIWTDPDGHQTTTHPGSRRLFPELSTPTAPAVVTGTPPPKHAAGLTMPKRRTTRAAGRQRAIDDERRRKTEWVQQYLHDQTPPF